MPAVASRPLSQVRSSSTLQPKSQPMSSPAPQRRFQPTSQSMSRPVSQPTAQRPVQSRSQSGSPANSRPASPGSSQACAQSKQQPKPLSSNKPEHKILFQNFFKSVGPRTYAAQVKEANNGNHYLVLTEGKRDDKTGEIRKTRLFVFGEDFPQFFQMIKSTAEFIKANPLAAEVKQRREKFWAKQAKSDSTTQAARNAR